MQIKENISLKPYNTFSIESVAKYFVWVKDKDELIEAVGWAFSKNLPFFILGRGSNILLSDRKYNGLVIRYYRSSPKIYNKAPLEIDAGASLASIVRYAFQNHLTGLEWAVGIPGALGGAIRGNAAAFGCSISESVKQVQALKILKGEYKKINFSHRECKFGPKNSIFKEGSNLIILSVSLSLREGKQEEIKKQMKEHINYRKEKGLNYTPSAGSTFKNCYTKIKDKELLEKFPELKEFNRKGVIPAGYLVEKAGLKRKKIGGAMVYGSHANFIINTGDATAQDIKKLIKLIKQKVKQKFGVELEEEVSILD